MVSVLLLSSEECTESFMCMILVSFSIDLAMIPSFLLSSFFDVYHSEYKFVPACPFIHYYENLFLDLHWMVTEDSLGDYRLRFHWKFQQSLLMEDLG